MSSLRAQLEQTLASIKIGVTPYFKVVHSGRVVVPDGEVDPHLAAKIGRSLGVDGVYTGSVNLMRVADEPYTRTMPHCLEYEKPDKRYEYIAPECVNLQQREVKCRKRTATVVVTPRLVNTSNGHIIYQATLTGTAEDQYCEGGLPSSIKNDWQMLQASIDQALEDLKADVAPHSVRVRLPLMDNTDGLSSESARVQFTSAVKFLKENRADRGCPVLRQLEQQGERSPDLFYDLSVCAYLDDNPLFTHKYCQKADHALDEPNSFINTCLLQLSR